MEFTDRAFSSRNGQFISEVKPRCITILVGCNAEETAEECGNEGVGKANGFVELVVFVSVAVEL
jgi:hypothetical protein